MPEYSNGDIQRLHERIDTLQSDIQGQLRDGTNEIMNLTIAVAKIETKLSMTPPAASRPCTELKDHLTDHKGLVRPCRDLENHLADHKETRSLWQTPIVANIISLIRMGIVALITWAIVRA